MLIWSTSRRLFAVITAGILAVSALLWTDNQVPDSIRLTDSSWPPGDRLLVEIESGVPPVTARVVGPKALVSAAREGYCRPNRHGCPFSIDWGDGVEAEAPGQPADPLSRIYSLSGQFVVRASTVGVGLTGHLSRTTWSGSTYVSVRLGGGVPKREFEFTDLKPILPSPNGGFLQVPWRFIPDRVTDLRFEYIDKAGNPVWEVNRLAVANATVSAISLPPMLKQLTPEQAETLTLRARLLRDGSTFAIYNGPIVLLSRQTP